MAGRVVTPIQCVSMILYMYHTVCCILDDTVIPDDLLVVSSC